MSWWVISSESLQEMLRRVAGGEDPDLIYIEFYCNAEREDYRDGARESSASGPTTDG